MTQEFETLFEKLWEKSNYPTPTNLIRPNWYTTKPNWYSNYITDFNHTTNQRTYFTENGLYVSFDLPGFNNENLKVEITENTLTIEGKRYYNTTTTDESQTETIYKTYSLTDKNYDYTTAKAEVTDGVLTIYFPKNKKEKKKVLTLI